MEDNDFDPGLNTDYHLKYDNQASAASNVIGGGIAATVDFGASVWNSLPGTEEVRTADMLKRIDSNALRVYEEHTDSVETASFIGGMLVPSGIAMKGLGMARAGVKGANWFSKAGREADLAKVEELFQQGPIATKLYRKAQRELYGKGFANQILDAAVMEAAVVGTMSAHPLMEDYMQDFSKNFGISMAFGGVLGGTLGHVADRFAIKNVVGKAESSAASTVLDELSTAYKSTQNATQIQVQEANIKSLQSILDAEDGVYNGLTKSIADKVLKSTQADQAARFEEMLSPELQKAPDEVKQAIKHMFTSNTAMSGANEVTYLTQKMEGPGSLLKKGIDKLVDSPIFQKFSVKHKDGTSTEKLTEVAYFPEFGRFASPKDAAHYARARDLGLTPREVDAASKAVSTIPNTSWAEEVLSKNSASIDKDYIAALKRVDNMSAAELKALAIAPDDLPMINALLARSHKEPDLFSNAKFTVTRNTPNYGVVEQTVFKQNGVKPNHIQELHKLTGDNPKYNMMKDTTLSMNARNFIDDWISGSTADKSYFRAAVDNHLRGGSIIDAQRGSAIAEIMNSPTRKALLEELRKHADADGNIYLWRGTRKGKAAGHSAVESYTTSHAVAKSFGQAKLYKVHVDDVIGSVTNPRKFEEREILVGSPARQTEATLPIANLTQAFANKVNSVSEGMGIEELSASLLRQKETLINTMLARGVPIETIAIRTNTPLSTTKAFAGMPEGTTLDELGVFSEYRSAAQIGQYLAQDKRSLLLKSSIPKQSFSQLKSGMDVKTMTDIHHTLTATMLGKSQSTIANSVGDYFFGTMRPALDILRSEISSFVNSKAGSKFWNSTDHYVRDMGSAGAIASTIGKDVQELANSAISTVLKPIKDRMASIVTDATALVEANVALNLNASLKGHRVYKDRQFWQKETIVQEGVPKEVLVPVKFRGQDFKVASDKTDALLQEMQAKGRELYHMKNTIHEVLGKNDMSDIGFWAPSINPRDKFISYVFNKSTGKTAMLWGNTAEELAEAERVFITTVPEGRFGKEIQLITKSDQRAYNALHGRNDAVTMEIANVEMQKGGAAASANIKANTDAFTELAEGYEHYIGSQVRQMADIAMHDVTDLLDRMSDVNQHYFKDQALSPVKKMVTQPEDAARVIKNTLLGNTNLNEYTGWRNVNQSFETGLSLGVSAVSKVWDTLTGPLKRVKIGGKKELAAEDLQKLDYETLAKELEKQGVVNPWAAYDDAAAEMYGLAKLADHKDASKRLVYASNAFAATVALRIGELAQPLVNAMSLPILTSLAIANRMPDSFMGVAKGTAKVSGVQVMYEGVRAMHDPKFKHLGDLWEKRGYFKPLVSEATNILSMARGFQPGAITQVERALDSGMVNMMSKPADFSESVVRKTTMYTGAMLAKRLYPELDDVGVTIFARDFMDRAVGNYHASQRPVFFQGTMGVAMGLFQTYMLTLGQSVYRGLELKNYKALGKAALIQSGIFGAQSLPGFHTISEKIGEHFSDDNVDLQTGTYRALNDKLANFVLYGLPSNIGSLDKGGAAFYTRGEISPRVPNVVGGGIDNLVGVNMVMQTVDMASHVASSFGNDLPDVARAFGEALSMQSMSRPLARLSELGTGYSVTRQGNTVATPEEVWTPTGIISRVLSTRPLQEAKLREAQHLNSHYGSLDREARSEVTKELKTAIRNDSLNDDLLARLADDYISKGGTPTGWRSAVNTAIGQSNVSGRATLMSKLDPDSPLMHMIDSQDGE